MESFHLSADKRTLVLSDWKRDEIRRFALPWEFVSLGLASDLVGEYVADGLGEFFLLHEQGMRLALAVAVLAGARKRDHARVRRAWESAFGLPSEEVLYWFTKCYYGAAARQKAFRKAVKLVFEAEGDR